MYFRRNTSGKLKMAIKFKGIGHVAIRCKNFNDEFDFYTTVLGFKKILDIYDEKGEIWITYLRVKKGQYIELFHKTKCHPQKYYVSNNEQYSRSPFNVSFGTNDMKSISTYLKDNRKEKTDNKSIFSGDDSNIILDPEGNECEFLASPK